MTEAAHPRLAVRQLSKVFHSRNGSVHAVEDVSLEQQAAEFITVIGPSGCGKSTFLNLVAGLDEPSGGFIELDGQRGPRLGKIGYMPQRDLLMPWRTVLDNTILGLETSGVKRKQAWDQAREWLPLFGLSGFADHYPDQLSGGMRQRASLMRTFLAGREMNLLDEPFGKLDSLTRMQLQQWLLDFSVQQEKTILLITHDIEEAIFLSDRVYVMSPRPGRFVYEATVPLARPRRFSEAVVDPAFVALKHTLLDQLGPKEDIQ